MLILTQKNEIVNLDAVNKIYVDNRWNTEYDVVADLRYGTAELGAYVSEDAAASAVEALFLSYRAGSPTYSFPDDNTTGGPRPGSGKTTKSH